MEQILTMIIIIIAIFSVVIFFGNSIPALTEWNSEYMRKPWIIIISGAVTFMITITAIILILESISNPKDSIKTEYKRTTIELYEKIN